MRTYVWLALGLVSVGGLIRAAEKPPEVHVNAMKANGAAQMSLRGNVTARNYDGIVKDAATLKASLTTTEQWWTARKADDAIAAARAGLKAATDLESAAQAKNDEGIANAQRALQGACMSCHQAHRERLPDGTYEIK
jgi:cytochrome c556